MLLFKRILGRDNKAALSTRTVTIESDAHPNWKYLVTVHTEHAPKKDGPNVGPENQTFGFIEQQEAIDCANQMVADSEANGYKLSP